jgi:hypothetical protein
MKRATPRPAEDDVDTSKGAQQSVRIVRASDAAPVATSAPRSIFDAVKPESRPKVERASIDLSSVVIRTDVPLPPIRPGVAAIYPQLWERIPAGGMVELPDRQAHGLMAHVKKTGAKAAVRKLREGVKGVWRLA